MKKIDLDKDKKIKSPYQVHDGYFESLTNRIQERASDEKKEIIPVFKLKWLAVPAMVIIAAVILWYPNNNVTQASMDSLLEDVSAEEIEDYLAFTQVSEYEIANIMEGTDELPEEEEYLEGIELNEGDINDILIEFDITEEWIDS